MFTIYCIELGNYGECLPYFISEMSFYNVFSTYLIFMEYPWFHGFVLLNVEYSWTIIFWACSFLILIMLISDSGNMPLISDSANFFVQEVFDLRHANTLPTASDNTEGGGGLRFLADHFGDPRICRDTSWHTFGIRTWTLFILLGTLAPHLEKFLTLQVISNDPVRKPLTWFPNCLELGNCRECVQYVISEMSFSNTLLTYWISEVYFYSVCV